MIFTKEATVTKTTWRDREMKPYDMWVIKYVDGTGETCADRRYPAEH